MRLPERLVSKQTHDGEDILGLRPDAEGWRVPHRVPAVGAPRLEITAHPPLLRFASYWIAPLSYERVGRPPLVVRQVLWADGVPRAGDASGKVWVEDDATWRPVLLGTDVEDATGFIEIASEKLSRFVASEAVEAKRHAECSTAPPAGDVRRVPLRVERRLNLWCNRLGDWVHG